MALTFVRRSDTVLEDLQRLLDRVKHLEVRIKRLFLDRGFDNNAIIGYLHEQPFPTIMALTMLNLWVFVKWTFVSSSRRGGRLVRHHLLPLARWRLWLWEVVKQRLGVTMEVWVPSTA